MSSPQQLSAVMDKFNFFNRCATSCEDTSWLEAAIAQDISVCNRVKVCADAASLRSLVEWIRGDLFGDVASNIVICAKRLGRGHDILFDGKETILKGVHPKIFLERLPERVSTFMYALFPRLTPVAGSINDLSW